MVDESGSGDRDADRQPRGKVLQVEAVPECVGDDGGAELEERARLAAGARRRTVTGREA